MAHRATGFPLVGAHAAADCTSCHDTLRQDRWTRPAADCYSCHARDYQRADVHPNHVTANFSKSCDTCPAQDAFSPARVRHDLSGARRVLRLGALASATAAPRACYDRYQDEYAAAADPPHASFGLRQCRAATPSSPGPGQADLARPGLPIRTATTPSPARSATAGALPPANFTCIGCHTQATLDVTTATSRLRVGELRLLRLSTREARNDRPSRRLPPYAAAPASRPTGSGQRAAPAGLRRPGRAHGVAR
jgi:hypothetical protein